MKTLSCVLLAAAVGVASFAADSSAIPAGTEVAVRLEQTISSATSHSGDKWAGSLAEDLMADGKTVAHKGAAVEGRVSEAKASGRLAGPGILKLELISVDGHAVNSGLVSKEGDSHKGRNLKSAGGGAALGAIIGAIAGGGKGAAIGAGAGAAAGTAGAAATGKKDVKYPVETVLHFTIR